MQVMVSYHPRIVACRSTFWACLTLEHIRHDRIQSVYLAANGGALPGGAERIDVALNDSTARAPQLIDSCVRTVLAATRGASRGAWKPFRLCRLSIRTQHGGANEW